MGRVRTGVGRIVWGNPQKSQQKRDNNKQPLFRDGKAVMQWAFGVAFPKAQFQQEVWPEMAAEAAKLFPNGAPQKFAWKWVDGDGVDGEGKPFANREGYAGCFVLAVSTESNAPPCFKFNGTNYDQLQDGFIKCGDYVSLALNIVGHPAKESTHNPGLYINPDAVEFVAYGAEIFNGPDAMTLFGGRTHALPQGASTVPVNSGGGVGMPGMQQQPMQMQPQQPMQMQPQQPMQMQPQQPMQMQPQQPMQMQPQQPMQMQPQQPGMVQPAIDYVQQTTGGMMMQQPQQPMQQQPTQMQPQQPMQQQPTQMQPQQPMQMQPGMMPGR